jgi:hypothetical protein
VLRIVHACGAQLPTIAVERVALDGRDLGVRHERIAQRRGPVRDQGIHAGLGDPVRFACGQGGFGDAAVRVEHAHEVGAPGAAELGHGFEHAREARIAHREVLGAAVELAEGCGFARHPAAGGGFALEHADAVAGLHEGARAGDARHAGADDGVVARGVGSVAIGDGAGGGHGGGLVSVGDQGEL